MDGNKAGGWQSPPAAPPLAGTQLVRTVAAGHARSADRRARLDHDVVEAIVGAGFARHFVPARRGGHEGAFGPFVDAVAEVGEGCTSAAWCAALYAIYGRIAAHLPAAGQDEVWAGGPDVLIAGAINPGGRVEAVPGGGWRLSGRWPFLSGVDHAAWILLGGMAPGADGPELRYFAVPRRDLRIERTWDPVGMRGTGSHSVLVDGVDVPPARSFSAALLWAGEPGATALCMQVPFKLVNGLTFTAPMLGAARAALAGWVTAVTGRRDPAGAPCPPAERLQHVLGRAAADIDAAHLLLERAARTADAGAPTAHDVVRGPRDFSRAAELLCAAADELLRTGGASGYGVESTVARAWRDLHGAAGHFALQSETNRAAYARHVLVPAPGGSVLPLAA